MPYNKEELLNLPVEEKLQLVEALWEKINEESVSVTKEEIEFARKRFDLHKENPSEGLSWEEVKNKITEKYGF